MVEGGGRVVGVPEHESLDVDERAPRGDRRCPSLGPEVAVDLDVDGVEVRRDGGCYGRVFQLAGLSIGGVAAGAAAVAKGEFSAAKSIFRELDADLDKVLQRQLFSQRLAANTRPKKHCKRFALPQKFSRACRLI